MTFSSASALRSIAPLLCLVVGVAACAPSAAQSPEARVEAFAQATDFSGVVLWAAGDEVAVRTFGWEDVEAGTPTRAETRYQLGSISKWIATLVTFRLAEAGVLDLDALVSAYLPEYRRDSGERLTLHHLVTHTSGVPNGLIEAFQSEGPTFLDRSMPLDSAVARLASGDLQFEPGSRFDYSHANWILVQAILEGATGQPYAALVHEHLIAPLGLTGTEVITGRAFASDGLAVGYASLTPPERADIRFQSYLAATGGTISSAGDLLILLDALYNGELLSPALRTRLDSVVVEDEGYASGGRVRTMDLGRGAEAVAWHTGSNGPSKSRIARTTESGLTVITLSNTGADSDDTEVLAEALLESMADVTR